MPTTITEQKFNDLKTKLRELFELDKSDLDFGIYRIMAAKNREVTEFLDTQLRKVVADTLDSHGVGAENAVQAELDKAISNAQSLGVDPDSVPKVKELKAKLASAGGTSRIDLEADIYNHLLAFFSRYYEEGDFISQRRFKGDTYAIPYDGKEVALHWANKDQYYIKSGEWHQDYRFKVGSKSVHFKLAAATQEVNNNKESDQSKRRYILRDENPIDAAGDVLTLFFEFRAPTDSEKARAADGAVAIFGGKYAGSTKGDEREQFCADAEKRALTAIPDAWQKIVTQPAATETKPLRTILGKHLDAFTARNTFDYFIHKDLGTFLRRELDFYIKNEVIRLDDLESLPPDHLQRVQGKVKAIRTVATRVIAFLASVEEFQRKLWLKKKLVLNTHWLVTIDRISVALRDQVAASARQWAAWVDLGFKPQEFSLGMPEWGTRAYLDANDKLPVDTSLFPPEFTAALLASDEVLAGKQTVDDATTGVLIHSENFQALNLIRERYRGQIKCVYIDPPYNTDASAILYKNDYKSSAWMSLIAEGVSTARYLIKSDGLLAFAIDDAQVSEARAILKGIFPHELGVAVVRSNPQSRKTKGKFSPVHEYALFYGNSASAVPGSLDATPERMARYPKTDEKGQFAWMNFIRTGNNDRRADRPKLYYPIYVAGDDSIRVPQLKWNPDKGEYGEHEALDDPTAGEVVVFPVVNSNAERIEKNWHRGAESVMADRTEYRVRRASDGAISIDFKTRMDDESLPTTWWDRKEYASANYGAMQMKERFGENPFDYPKALGLVRDAIIASHVEDDSIVLDFFGGSGTTGEAVIDLNRSGRGAPKFVLVEMGRHFHAVIKLRIAKVLYSPDWKDGTAQSHGKGISALVKCFALESYDDALNNLPAPTGDFLPGADSATKQAMLEYSLDLELGPSLLKLDAFSDPWNFHINAQPAGEAEITPHRVDLVDTFNYLIGLKVSRYGAIRTYDGEFERAKHDDALGRLKLVGKPRPTANGRFRFQEIEGELLDGKRVLIVWRTLTDNPEEDAAMLESLIGGKIAPTTERGATRSNDLVYINGPVTLPQPTAEIRTVWPIEQTFKDRMFTDDGGK